MSDVRYELYGIADDPSQPRNNDQRLLTIPRLGTDGPLVDVSSRVPKRGLVGQRLSSGPELALAHCEDFARPTHEKVKLAPGWIALEEGHGSPPQQMKEYELEQESRGRERPAWNPELPAMETAGPVAPPGIRAPHAVGGAADIIVLDADGVEFDLDSEIDEFELRLGYRTTYSESRARMGRCAGNRHTQELSPALLTACRSGGTVPAVSATGRGHAVNLPRSMRELSANLVTPVAAAKTEPPVHH